MDKLKERMDQVKKAIEASVITPFTPEDARETRALFEDACSFIYLESQSLNKPRHPFFSHFIQGLRLQEVNWTPLGAVSFSSRSPIGNLYLNPRNAKNLTIPQFAGLVIHEIYHLMLGHLNAPEVANYPKLANIAMDMEINQMVLRDGYHLPMGKIIADKPDFEFRCCLPETVAAKFGKEPPEADQTWQFYLNWLIDATEELKSKRGQEPSSKPGSRSIVDDILDELNGWTDHECWDEGLSPEEKEILERYIAQAVQEAVRNGGTLPGHLETAYQKLIKCLTPEFSLENYLDEFMGGCGEVHPYVRRLRLNKHGLPGYMAMRPDKSVGVVIDTSGSVTNEEYGYGLGLILKLSQVHNIEVIVQETSYGVTNAMWRLSEKGIKEFYERNGYGGTNMRPGIEAFLREIEEGGEFQVGGIIVFSDGQLGSDSAIPPEDCPLSLLWVFTREATEEFLKARKAGTIIPFKMK